MKTSYKRIQTKKNRGLKVSLVILSIVLFLFLYKDDFTKMNHFIAFGGDKDSEYTGQEIPDSTLEGVYEYIDSLKPLNTSDVKVAKCNDDGIFEITGADENFHVLQITDTHISGNDVNYGKNIAAMRTVYELVQREAPDFIVVTGDLIFGTETTSYEEDSVALDLALKFMDKLGVSWTWSYGNHDHNAFDHISENEINTKIDACSNLYMSGQIEGVTGGSNALFKIYQGDTLISALFSLDSNSDILDQNKDFVTYGYIDDSQVSWYEDRIKELQNEGGADITTFLFTHIPLQEYDQVDEAISGVRSENVSCSEVSSNIFDKIVELGSTKGIFCGHDHLNYTISQYKGVYLVYSKSIDYTAYVGIDQKTQQRGACSIQLTDHNYNINNISY